MYQEERHSTQRRKNQGRGMGSSAVWRVVPVWHSRRGPQTGPVLPGLGWRRPPAVSASRSKGEGACATQIFVKLRHYRGTGLIDFNLDLVAVRVAYEGGKALAHGTVVHLRLGGLHTLALEGGDDVVNT